MTEQTRYFAAILSFVILISALVGGVFGTTFTSEQASDLEIIGAFLRGVYTGIVISVPLTITELALNRTAFTRWRRSKPFALALLFDSFLYTSIIIFGLASGALLFAGPAGSDFGWNTDTGIQVVFAFAISMLVNVFIVLNRMTGQGVILNIVLGRYHKPVSEDRVILFIDMKGSTAIAEQIGDLAFHELLNCFYSDITLAVLHSKGTIHKYVGDEIIISWPAKRTKAARKAIACHQEAKTLIAGKSAEYEAEFGVCPEFRAALHTGPVVIGEMGDIKLEIAYSGDAMNTTGRLMGACRELAQDCIASAALLRGTTLPDNVTVEHLPPLHMRGKDKPVPVAALHPAQ